MRFWFLQRPTIWLWKRCDYKQKCTDIFTATEICSHKPLYKTDEDFLNCEFYPVVAPLKNSLQLDMYNDKFLGNDWNLLAYWMILLVIASTVRNLNITIIFLLINICLGILVMIYQLSRKSWHLHWPSITVTSYFYKAKDYFFVIPPIAPWRQDVT